MSKEYNLSTKHATDEVLEHVIMEKTGVLKGHHDHFLPKKKEKKEKKEKTTATASLQFLLVGYAIVALELWVLYKGLYEWNWA